MEPMDMPFKTTEPEVGWSRPAHNPSSVVFPLPEGPRMEQVAPSGSEKEMFLSTVRSPAAVRYVLVSC